MAARNTHEREVKVVEQRLLIRAWMTEEAYEQLGGDDLEDPRVGQLRADIDAEVRRAADGLQSRLRTQFAGLTVRVDELG